MRYGHSRVIGWVFGIVAATCWPSSEVSAATVTWKAAPANQSWSNTANWVGGLAPANGDAVVFPAASNIQNSDNDIAGLSLASITLDGNGYTLTGVPVTIGASGISCTTGNAPQTNSIGFSIALGADATITIAPGCQLLLGGVISGAHSLTKDGFGALQLSAPNTFSGTLTVNLGALIASSASALGAGDGTPSTGSLVANGGSLVVSGATVGNERVDIQGSGNGGVGALIGTGTSGWNGPVVLASASTISGSNFTIGGVISGPFNLTVIGGNPGVTLTATNTHSGTTTITGGFVFVNGSLSGTSTVDVTGTGILGGIGVVNADVSAVGNIAPGHSPGILTTQSVSMVPGADLFAQLNGPIVGAQYSQLVVHGSVALGGADLNLSLGFLPSAGQQFLIVDNDGVDAVSGTFNGLAEGAAFAWNGSPFTISYLGGDGNDIVLTAGAGVPTLSAPLLTLLGTLLGAVTLWHIRSARPSGVAD